jgi:hypothetical protein
VRNEGCECGDGMGLGLLHTALRQSKIRRQRRLQGSSPQSLSHHQIALPILRVWSLPPPTPTWANAMTLVHTSSCSARRVSARYVVAMWVPAAHNRLKRPGTTTRASSRRKAFSFHDHQLTAALDLHERRLLITRHASIQHRQPVYRLRPSCRAPTYLTIG